MCFSRHDYEPLMGQPIQWGCSWCVRRQELPVRQLLSRVIIIIKIDGSTDAYRHDLSRPNSAPPTGTAILWMHG